MSNTLQRELCSVSRVALDVGSENGDMRRRVVGGFWRGQLVTMNGLRTSRTEDRNSGECYLRVLISGANGLSLAESGKRQKNESKYKRFDRDCQAWATTQARRGRRKHPAAARMNAASILGEMDERGWEGARTGGTVGSASRVRRGRVGVMGIPTARPTNPNTNPNIEEGGKSIRRRFMEDWHWLYTALGGERDFDYNTLALGPAPCVQGTIRTHTTPCALTTSRAHQHPHADRGSPAWGERRVGGRRNGAQGALERAGRGRAGYNDGAHGERMPSGTLIRGAEHANDWFSSPEPRRYGRVRAVEKRERAGETKTGRREKKVPARKVWQGKTAIQDGLKTAVFREREEGAGWRACTSCQGYCALCRGVARKQEW
ncbi:hypothetical protein B0H13DRAFT_2574384 [Mycena leptocephala]|nr:hypothetical protein B0H13DRAFT_2574384 [Mycena leptocephala]